MIPLLFTLDACIEYQPAGKPADVGPVTDPPEDSAPLGTLDVGLPEVCNGWDDDRDGLVDEGFADVDADGRADCVDQACVPQPEVAGAPAPACGGEREVVDNPWDLEIIWEIVDEEADSCVGVAAADVDGDGVVEVFCNAGDLRVFSGTDGSRLDWETDFYERKRVVLAGMDGDWRVFGFDEDGFILAYEALGGLVWQSAEAFGSLYGFDYGVGMVVADLDADGAPEVITHRGAVSARDGSTVRYFDYDELNIGMGIREVVVADLDGDGTQEVVSQFACWNDDASLRWNLYPADPSSWWGPINTMVVQADTDPDGEIAILSDYTLRVVEPDGRLIREVPSPNNPDFDPLTACAVDVTEDGVSELIIGDWETIRAITVEGTVLWELPRIGWTTWNVCTVSDIDADGASEILYTDEENVWIVDAATGAPRFQDESWEWYTEDSNVFPIDLDGDGSLELLVTGSADSSAGAPTLRAYAPRARNWVGTANLWPNEVWSGTALQADGSVPRTPERAWLDRGRYRAAPDSLVSGANLSPLVAASCVASCEPDGVVALTLELHNAGPDELETPRPLSVYAADGRLLTTLWTTDWLDNHGVASFDWTTDVATAQAGLVLVAGDDGSTPPDDCHPEDDRVAWRLAACDAAP